MAVKYLSRIELPGDPINALEAVTKQYVDGLSPPVRETTSFTTASLAAGASESGLVSLALGYTLYELSTSAAARIRLYTTTTKRDADVSRPTSTVPDLNAGVVLDFETSATVLASEVNPLVQGYKAIESVTPGQTTTALNATQDTFVSEGASGTSYGTNVALASRGTSGYQSYLRFPIPAVPVGKQLVSAVLRIRTLAGGSDPSADTQTLSLVTSAWSNTTTWTTRPTIGSAIGTGSGFTTADTQYDITITDLASLVPSTNVDIAITSSGSDALWLHSTDATTATNRPTLRLTYDDAPMTGSIPYTVTNLSGATNAITVDLLWIGTED